MISIDESKVGIRVDKFLSEYLDIPRNKVSKNDIFVNGEKVKVSYKLKLGDSLFFDIIEEKEVEIKSENIDLEIVYEDEDIAIINKEANMVVHPSNTHKTKTLVNALLYKFKNLSSLNEEGPGIVHRLDKDTSGLIIIAKNNEVHEKLVEMFKEHKIRKTYIAIIRGKFTKQDYKIESFIGRSIKNRKKMSSNTNKGKLAISIFTSLDYNDKNSLVKVDILTGRTHQIRVHSKEMGHPLVGDHIYAKNDKFERQQLHAYRLVFNHPMTNQPIILTSKLPSDMEETLKKMKLEIDYARI